MSSYQHRKSHCGDKMVVRSSYLHNGISYTGKMTSLYWIRALVTLLVELVTTENSMDQLYEILSKHWFTFQLKPHTMLVLPSFAIKLVTDEDVQHHHRKAVRFWTSGLTEFGSKFKFKFKIVLFVQYINIHTVAWGVWNPWWVYLTLHIYNI